MKTATEPAVFVTAVRSQLGLARARLLIDSLRAFGGELSSAEFWIFEADHQHTPCDSLAGAGAHIYQLEVLGEVNHYLFADKVSACARAEELAVGRFGSLVWIDPGCLVIKLPNLLLLDSAADAAVRPVHIQNVGLLAEQPLDPFWKGIYKTFGVGDVQTKVESFVDRQQLRAYFNSHAFSVNPSLGLMRIWLDSFSKLVTDADYQQSACQDERHQIFLFQAILSILLVTRLDWERIRILPPDYNYPYNLQEQVPGGRRAKSLDELVCIAYEDRSLDPEKMNDISVSEPLRSWLAARTS